MTIGDALKTQFSQDEVDNLLAPWFKTIISPSGVSLTVNSPLDDDSLEAVKDHLDLDTGHTDAFADVEQKIRSALGLSKPERTVVKQAATTGGISRQDLGHQLFGMVMQGNFRLNDLSPGSQEHVYQFAQGQNEDIVASGLYSALGGLLKSYGLEVDGRVNQVKMVRLFQDFEKSMNAGEDITNHKWRHIQTMVELIATSRAHSEQLVQNITQDIGNSPLGADPDMCNAMARNVARNVSDYTMRCYPEYAQASLSPASNYAALLEDSYRDAMGIKKGGEFYADVVEALSDVGDVSPVVNYVASRTKPDPNKPGTLDDARRDILSAATQNPGLLRALEGKYGAKDLMGGLRMPTVPVPKALSTPTIPSASIPQSVSALRQKYGDTFLKNAVPMLQAPASGSPHHSLFDLGNRVDSIGADKLNRALAMKPPMSWASGQKMPVDLASRLNQIPKEYLGPKPFFDGYAGKIFGGSKLPANAITPALAGMASGMTRSNLSPRVADNFLNSLKVTPSLFDPRGIANVGYPVEGFKNNIANVPLLPVQNMRSSVAQAMEGLPVSTINNVLRNVGTGRQLNNLLPLPEASAGRWGQVRDLLNIPKSVPNSSLMNLSTLAAKTPGDKLTQFRNSIPFLPSMKAANPAMSPVAQQVFQPPANALRAAAMRRALMGKGFPKTVPGNMQQAMKMGLSPEMLKQIQKQQAAQKMAAMAQRGGKMAGSALDFMAAGGGAGGLGGMVTGFFTQKLPNAIFHLPRILAKATVEFALNSAETKLIETVGADLGRIGLGPAGKFALEATRMGYTGVATAADVSVVLDWLKRLRSAHWRRVLTHNQVTLDDVEFALERLQTEYRKFELAGDPDSQIGKLQARALSLFTGLQSTYYALRYNIEMPLEALSEVIQAADMFKTVAVGTGLGNFAVWPFKGIVYFKNFLESPTETAQQVAKKQGTELLFKQAVKGLKGSGAIGKIGGAIKQVFGTAANKVVMWALS